MCENINLKGATIKGLIYVYLYVYNILWYFSGLIGVQEGAEERKWTVCSSLVRVVNLLTHFLLLFVYSLCGTLYYFPQDCSTLIILGLALLPKSRKSLKNG